MNAAMTRKKTNRLFNVANQSQAAFVRASDVLIHPFNLSERPTDTQAELSLRMPPKPTQLTHA